MGRLQRKVNYRWKDTACLTGSRNGECGSRERRTKSEGENVQKTMRRIPHRHQKKKPLKHKKRVKKLMPHVKSGFNLGYR